MFPQGAGKSYSIDPLPSRGDKLSMVGGEGEECPAHCLYVHSFLLSNYRTPSNFPALNRTILVSLCVNQYYRALGPPKQFDSPSGKSVRLWNSGYWALSSGFAGELEHFFTVNCFFSALRLIF